MDTARLARYSFQRYGFLLRELVRRDFQGRYAGSLMGVLWSFAHPLWLLILYSIVFSTVLDVSLMFQRSDNFAIWMFCGLLPWLAIQEGVTRGTTVITDNANLVKKLSFPSEILALSVVISALLHEAVAAAVFVLVLLVIGEAPGWSLAWLLVAIPMQALLTLGLVYIVASFHVFFRDVGQILGMFMNGWFFLTPIVYPPYLVEEASPILLKVLNWNPLTTLVEVYRAAFLGGGVDASLFWGVGRFLLLSIVLFAVGSWVFGRLKPAFVDLI